jgi:hypothetical protein
MKNLSNYNEFSLKESILYLSPNLKNKLKKIDNPISNDILGVEGVDIKDDVTFLDFENDGYFSFSKMKNIKKVASNMDETEITENPMVSLSDQYYKLGSEIWKKSRNPIKVGRLINLLFPNKYKPNDIEVFTNQYKAIGEFKEESIIVVDGEDIKYWYDQDNYCTNPNTGKVEGSLANSCMRHKRCQRYFEIYIKNPEVCKLVCVIDNNENKLKARALLWKTNQSEKWLLDRIYYVSDEYSTILQNYAVDNNYDYVGKTRGYKSVSIKDISYEYYPYMDTFLRYDYNYCKLDNSEDNEDGYYRLQSTGGDYVEMNRGVWSEYEEEYIEDDEAVYSEHLTSYLYGNRSVYIERGRHSDWYPADSDNIVRTFNSYIHIEDATWSEYEGEYIHQDIAVRMISDIYINGNCPQDYECYVSDSNSDFIAFHKIVNSDYFIDYKENWDDYDGVCDDLVTRNSQYKYIIKMFAIPVYRTIDYSTEFLSEIDSLVLNVNIDKSESRIIDVVTYHNNLGEEILEEISNLLQAIPDETITNEQIKRRNLLIDFEIK